MNQKLRDAQDFRAAQRPSSGPVRLSTGRVILHERMPDGAQSALIEGDSEACMTEAEWEEYCQLIQKTRRRRWKLAGVDLEATSTRDPYVSEWRYGVAAEGEASTVMRTLYFDSPLAAVQYMAKRGYTVVA